MLSISAVSRMPPTQPHTRPAVSLELYPYLLVFFIGVCFVLFGYARSSLDYQLHVTGMIIVNMFQDQNITTNIIMKTTLLLKTVKRRIR